MNFEKILERFMLLSGLGYDEGLRWRAVLEESGNYVRGLSVKTELSARDSERLDALSGVLAYCRYVAYNAEISGGFRAGDLTVYADKSSLESVQKLWENELKLNSDLVSQTPFMFKKVV